MYGPPFSWSRRNPALLCPGPNIPEESTIKPGTTQVMEQACNLILAYSLNSMTQGHGHCCAHARSPHRMGPIIPANNPARMNGMRVIVEPHQLDQECTRNQERRICLGRSCHEIECPQAHG